MSKRTYKDPYHTKPCNIRPGDCFALKIVAVVGHNNDWAAYVASNGMKLTHHEAGDVFGVLPRVGLTYRH